MAQVFHQDDALHPQEIVYLTASQAAGLQMEQYAIDDGQGGHTIHYLTPEQVQQLCMPSVDGQVPQYELRAPGEMAPSLQICPEMPPI